MNAEESHFQESANGYMRANRTRLAKELTNTGLYPPEENPVAVFMAGSPGAGKTETAKALLEGYPGVLRIDPDDYRCLIPGYDGSNSYLLQTAVSLLVEKVLDMALKQKQSFLLDGTLSNYAKAESNIERCLRKDMVVQILFVHQEPKVAWQFVLSREAEEGRKIPGDRFVEQYFASQEVVQSLKDKFGQSIRVDVLLKNADVSTRHYFNNVDKMSGCIPKTWSRAEVSAIVTKPI